MREDGGLIRVVTKEVVSSLILVISDGKVKEEFLTVKELTLRFLTSAGGRPELSRMLRCQAGEGCGWARFEV